MVERRSAERALKSVPSVREEAPDVRELPPVVEAPPAAADDVTSGGEKLNRRRWMRWGLFTGT